MGTQVIINLGNENSGFDDTPAVWRNFITTLAAPRDAWWEENPPRRWTVVAEELKKFNARLDHPGHRCTKIIFDKPEYKSWFILTYS